MRQQVQLRDVAARVGLSTAAISLALRNSGRVSPAKRRLVRQAARELGYVRRVRRPHGRSECIRVAFLHVEAPLHPCDLARVPQSVTRVLLSQAAALNVTVSCASIPGDITSPAHRRSLTQLLEDHQGVLLLGMVQEPLVRFIQALRLPLVVLGETDITLDQALALKLQRVNCDALGMALCGTRALLQRGCRRLAFIGGIRDPGFYYDQWHDGFLLAHARAQRLHQPELVHFHEIDNPLNDRLGPLLDPRCRPDGIVWPDPSFAAALGPVLRQGGLKVDDLPQVIGGSVGETDDPQFAAAFRVLSDQGLMALQGLKHLKTQYHHPAETALSMHVPFVTRGFPPAAVPPLAAKTGTLQEVGP